MDVGRQKLRKNCNFYPSRATFSHEMDVKNWGKIATFIGRAQPFRTKWTLDVKNWGKIAPLLSQSQPWQTKWTLDVKNWAKNAMDVVCVKASVCKSVCVWQRVCVCKKHLRVKASVCKSVCVSTRLCVKAFVCESVCACVKRICV